MSSSESISDAPVQAGDVLAGKYAVEHVLGVGGMGVVVAARHTQLKQRVALKFLLPVVAENHEAVARFLREAENASQIQSEHVVRVTDVGPLESGAPYMVMEYLEGTDLGKTLEQSGRLQISIAVDYMLQALVAIAEAHVKGIVHRDLKPSNLFVTTRSDGSPLVKILDFGISKVAVPDSAQAASNLTRTGGMMGSPLYMSPEQIRSTKKVDRRSDIWSLGVILYELLAGRPPFPGDELPAVLASIVADAPDRPRSHRPDLPEALERVILKCLEKDPKQRFDDAGAFARALEPFASADARPLVQRVVGIIARAEGRSPAAASNPMATADTVALAGAPDRSGVGIEVAAGTAATVGAWAQGTKDGGANRRWPVAVGFGIVIAGAFAVWRMTKTSPGETRTEHPAAAPVTASPEPVAPSVRAPETPATAPPVVPTIDAPKAPASESSSMTPGSAAGAEAPVRAAPRVATSPRVPAPARAAPSAAPKAKKHLDVSDVIDGRR